MAAMHKTLRRCVPKENKYVFTLQIMHLQLRNFLVMVRDTNDKKGLQVTISTGKQNIFIDYYIFIETQVWKLNINVE